MGVSELRAKEIRALAEFQSIPSTGPRFAKDLIELGYYSLEELRTKDGAILLDEFEVLCGVPMDPCVEDQFRLVVYYANHPNTNKQWWFHRREEEVPGDERLSSKQAEFCKFITCIITKKIYKQVWLG